MDIFKSWRNKIVKGSRLKSLGLRFVKITNAMMFHNGFALKIGKNTDTHPLSTTFCSPGGIYFCPIDVFGLYFEFGDGFHYVDFADDEDIFIEDNKCKARTIILSEKINYNFITNELFKIAIKSNKFAIKYIDPNIKDYYEFCKISVAHAGISIQYMSPSIKNNYEICKAAASQNGKSIYYMDINMKFNPEICKIAAAQNGFSIKYMSPVFTNDPEICKIAAAQSGMTLYYMSPSIKNNYEICKAAVLNNKKAFRYIGKSLKHDEFFLALQPDAPGKKNSVDVKK
jgi:hypothetical protein